LLGVPSVPRSACQSFYDAGGALNGDGDSRNIFDERTFPIPTETAQFANIRYR
jgi:hypothetical protein